MGREEDVPEVVERLRERGVDCVKVLDTVAPAIAARIRAEAHAAGLRVIGHAPNGSDRLLLDEAQHLTGLGSALRTRHPTALAKAVADSLAERTAHTPTLVVLERFAQVSEGERPCSKGCRSLPRYFQSVLWDPRRIPAVDLMVRDLGFAPRERFEAAKEVVAALARGGVPILAGTDSPTFYNVPGESLHEEIALLHEAGLPAEDALAAATTRAAEALGEARLGRIEPGAPADFVLLRADPVQSVENRTWLDIAAVVVDGRLYRIDELETSLREYERFFEESAYSWLIEVAVRAAFSRPAGGARP
jgi:imidazolonepropionase-like amidohydrolase